MSKYTIIVEQEAGYRGVEYWTAYEDNLFDADFDGEGYVANYAQATGNSKWDAIEDLLLSIREQEEREANEQT